MSAAHTPGPWSYVRNPENTRWIIDSAPSHAIACTAGHEPDNEANARLITAAPELLRDCGRLVSLLESYELAGGPNGHVAQARATIAKALGRTPIETSAVFIRGGTMMLAETPSPDSFDPVHPVSTPNEIGDGCE